MSTEECKATPYLHRDCGGVIVASLDGEQCARCGAELRGEDDCEPSARPAMPDARPHHHDTDRAADTCPACFPDGRSGAELTAEAVTAAAEALYALIVNSHPGDGSGDYEPVDYAEDLARAALAAAAPSIESQAAAETPAVDGEPLTHFFHCWRFPKHHACAVALIEREADKYDSLLMRSGSAERKGMLAERDHILGEDPAQGFYRLGRADEREQIRQLAIKHHASYAVSPDVPFSVLREFADLLGETP